MTNGNIISLDGRIPLPALTRAITNNIQPSGDDVMLSITKTLTDAQIKALPTAAFDLIPAPGSGKAIFSFYAFIRMNWFADYTNIDYPNSQLKVGLATGMTHMQLNDSVNGDFTSLFAGGGPSVSGFFMFAGTFRAHDNGVGFLDSVAGYYDGDIENSALQLSISNAGDLTDGDSRNELKVTVYYDVVSF